MIGAQIKEFNSGIKEENKKTFKASGSKKNFDNVPPASGKMDQSKKLVFQFKKESKQKITPPHTVSN